MGHDMLAHFFQAVCRILRPAITVAFGCAVYERSFVVRIPGRLHPLLQLACGIIQEEIVRLENHVQHFLGLLDEHGEVGKKLDFLLQEMNREANTLLSKTSGIAGNAAGITEIGLGMKAEIEKAREQVQNLE